MKVIFLDIDGVLNSNDWYVYRWDNIAMDSVNSQYPFYEFDPKAIVRLNRIIEKTEAKIVVSSSWRSGQTIESLQKLLNSVGIIGDVIGLTPHLQSNKPYEDMDGYRIPRGCEIDWWLDNHGDFQRINWSKEEQIKYVGKAKIKNYIILDDDSDMLYGQREHFIKTPHMTGLTDELADKAIEILNKSIVDLYYKETQT
jgi:hypothetical protein